VLLQFLFDCFCNLAQRIADIAIGQTSLRQIGTSAAFAADTCDEIASLKSALDDPKTPKPQNPKTPIQYKSCQVS